MNIEDFTTKVNSKNVIVVDVDPPTVFEKGHPFGSKNVQISRFDWPKDVRKLMGNETKSLVVYSINSLVANEAEKLAVQSGLPLEGVFSSSLFDLEKAGIKIVRIPMMTVDDLRYQMEKFTIIDVREVHELKSGVIPNSKNLPLSEIKREIRGLEKGIKYATICARGNRSREAANIIIENGYEAVTVEGGMAIWLQKDQEVSYPEDLN